MSSSQTRRKKPVKRSRRGTGSTALNFVPKKFQTAVIKFMISHGAAAVFLDPGLGKTVCSIYSYDILRKKRLVKKALIVSSRRIIHNVWPKEIAKWGFPLTHAIVHGGPHKRKAALAQDVDIHLTNYDSLAWLASQPKSKLPDWDVLIVDESTKFKSPKSLRFRSLKRLMLHRVKFLRRYILTGTPTPNSLIELFGQIYILDFGKRFGPLFTKFKEEFFRQAGYMGYEWRPYVDTEKRILKLIKDITIRFDEDQLNLPPLVPVIRWVDLPAKARRKYDELEEEFFTLVDRNRIVSAVSAGVASMKLRQIANGQVYTDKNPLEPAKGGKKRKWVRMHEEKIEDLDDLISELNGAPLLVGYQFDHDRQHITRELGDIPFIDGSTSDTEATSLIQKFSAGKIKVLLAQMSTVAHGLDGLQDSCHHICAYGMTWNAEEYEQFWRRVRRQGQKKKTFFYHIIARGTVEEAMYERMQGKDHTQKRFLQQLKQYRREKKHGSEDTET